MHTAIHMSKNKNQQGFSLLIVIVLVMLSMLLALWGSRTALFNEMVVGNDADYQRAFEAAQALMQDAELDIRGERPDGSPCTVDAAAPDVCRPANSGIWFPVENKDLPDFFTKLQQASEHCSKGVCLKRTGSQDFWSDKTTLDTMIAADVGARYGQFTGAEKGTAGSKASNSILNATDAEKGGWYWIEVMPYDADAGNSGLISDGSTNLALNLKPNVAYRITAVARGLKKSTQVVLQSTYVRQKIKD